MPSFLYFVPNRQAGLTDVEIRTIGLGYALEGSIHQQSISAGPDGGPGVLLSDASHCEASRTRFAPDQQEWIKIPAGWIGRWTNEVIGPGDLVREKPIDGHFVELADGNRWLCPVARSHGIEGDSVRWYHALPRGVSLGDDRKWHPGEVVPKYRHLWKMCLAWYDARLAAAPADSEIGDTIAFDFDGLHEAATECLATNYRISGDEISLLGLFDSDSARKVLDALIDVPSMVRLAEDMQKKTEFQAAGG